MKHMLKKIFSVAALLSTAAVFGAALPSVVEVAPYYSVRSQGVDAARELAGWSQHVNLFDMDKVYGTGALTVEYAQSFRSQSIARSLFGSAVICNDDCDDSVVNVSGSRAACLGANDLLADNFYLPGDYQSQLVFKPRIQNVVVDLNFYLGFDHWCQGLFFRLDLPINWSRWNLGFCERTIDPGTAVVGAGIYDPGYFSDQAVNFDAALTGSNLRTFSDYALGFAPANVTTLDGDPVVFNPLCYGKFGCGSDSTTRLADVQFIFGWNFLNDEDYHMGVGLLTRAPTGNRPNGRFLFEPIVGNGGHWELGAHFTSHATLWRCESEESSLGFYLDANITHLFKAKQTRVFDLVNKPLSRYMLASQFAPTAPNVANTGDALAGGATAAAAVAPNFQFANAFTPVANLTAQDVHVSVGVQGDLAAQFTYVNGGWNWDLGYNFWGRSCEKFSCNDCDVDCAGIPCFDSCNNSCDSSCNACPVSFAENSFGLKGDAYVYGFDNTAVPNVSVPLSATESRATIYSGTNFTSCTAPTDAELTAAQQNPNIDNAALAFHGTNGNPLESTPVAGSAQTNTSVQPVLISKARDFNYVGTRGISNKIYTHLSYNWVGCDRWVPYVGVGAFGEFGNRNDCDDCPASCNVSCNTNCNTSCDSSCETSCVKTALSQWGVWVKGGVSFN